ncbi:unnamed protein product [Mytilus edulis]|uniref:Mab-21-like HhH/H2TH-like domain-containing protein n=1 Tax=Mytilus edulis TaxID=6550 RepID=A0A8S3S801_MYTED|nr:unnamed protein product [Mytilus edulis]
MVDAHALSGAVEDGLGTHYSDYVVALTMNEWPQMAKSFINRDRHGWPSPDLIKNIVDQGCGFVATAHPICKNNDLQWQMSSAKSEQILVRSLNQTQIRAYLFFKSLFKLHLLKPECLSSYMMNNVLFWTLELVQTNKWSPENIMYCVESLVNMLCAYLNKAIIPHFFFSNQNLIGHIEKKKTLKKIAKKANGFQDNVLAMIIKYAVSSDLQEHTKIVDVWRTPLYIRTFKQILEDQELITNKNAISIPSLENFLEWVNLTCLLEGGQEIRFNNLSMEVCAGRNQNNLTSNLSSVKTVHNCITCFLP